MKTEPLLSIQKGKNLLLFSNLGVNIFLWLDFSEHFKEIYQNGFKFNWSNLLWPNDQPRIPILNYIYRVLSKNCWRTYQCRYQTIGQLEQLMTNYGYYKYYLGRISLLMKFSIYAIVYLCSLASVRLGTIHKGRLANGGGRGVQKCPKQETFTSRFEETRGGRVPQKSKIWGDVVYGWSLI